MIRWPMRISAITSNPYFCLSSVVNLPGNAGSIRRVGMLETEIEMNFVRFEIN